MSIYGTNPVRSPAYPSMPLADAIGAVSKIEGSYRLANVDREVAAKLLGYSGVNGPSAKALAALAHYGLVERAGKGELRVTARARSILHPDSETEKRECLQAAAVEPDLFRELQERWPDIIPPEDGVTTYLNRKGFNQSAIRPAARAYIQTMLFLQEAKVSESYGGLPAIIPESGDDNEPEVKMTALSTISSPKVAGPLLAVPTRSVFPAAFANAAPTVNQIGMNVQGHLVHLEAVLDYDGLVELESKITALKTIIARPAKPEPTVEEENASEE